MKKFIFLLIITILTSVSCKNKDINEGEQFRPREVHDSFSNVTFSKVVIDGIEYLMLERDNNNPHEGFGFMAFRANNLIEKQDSVIAHLKTQGEIQSRIYAQLFGISAAESDSIYRSLFTSYIREKQVEINSLKEENLKETIADPKEE